MQNQHEKLWSLIASTQTWTSIKGAKSPTKKARRTKAEIKTSFYLPIISFGVTTKSIFTSKSSVGTLSTN